MNANNTINIIESEEDKKLLLTDIKTYILKKTFTITYVLLITTAVITFIEAIRTPNQNIRHIFNLETCISFVASYFYSIFMIEINKGTIDWNNITQTRYIDWSITTPMMLLALCLVLSINSKTIIHIKIISSIIILNYIMLFIGYLGEIKKIGRYLAMILGFIPFLLMYYIIYVNYIKPKYSKANYIIFGMYFIIWSLYGIVYLFDEEYKNMITNILDLIAKCIVGIGLWVYYINIIHM